MSTEVKVPDIGDFADVEIIEIHVSPGDTVAPEDPLITLESDKAAIDVPSPAAGVVEKVLVKQGDLVSEGVAIVALQAGAGPVAEASAREAEPVKSGLEPQPEAAGPAVSVAKGDLHAEVLVLGSGPGGYTAAFRAADLGKKTVLVERYPDLGGVCLNVGCIPSKALLHVAKVISETKELAGHGVNFGAPEIDNDKLRSWKNKVLGQLTGGLKSLAKQRKVEVLHGRGEFTSPNLLDVATNDGQKTVSFDHAIIAAGSQAVALPGIADDPRVLDSTSALELEEIPKRLLVIGGGIIGLEMATVYHELGSRVTVVELLPELMTGADPDIVKPLHRRVAKQYENIYLKTKVASVEARKRGLKVAFEGGDAPSTDTFDRILVAVGRKPNGHNIGANKAGVEVDERGFIAVDRQQRTNVSHIFAIGDIVGQPMLAHKATHEGKVAAEVAAGHKAAFDARVIPSVAYTDPEVAWVGVTETEAKQQGLNYGKGVFPWAASGRSLALNRVEGITKLLFDEDNGRIIGAGIVGPNAGDLIAEAALAIEMDCDAEDIGLTIHPHPTLSETVAFAAEAYTGTITDLYIGRKTEDRRQRTESED
ncbi:MAG: dihydrolipoyl dehydrogenase [Gammaproteobacteria bacterium]